MPEFPDTLPQWTLDDAYGSVNDARFLQEKSNAQKALQTLKEHLEGPALSVIEAVALMPVYEQAFESISSMVSFAYCASSIDITDTDASSAYAAAQAMLSELDSISKPLFVALGGMDGDDSRWNDPALSHWRFNVMEKKHSWKNGLSSQDNTTITAFAATNFFPVDAMFKRLNKTLNVSAQKSKGEQVQLSHAQCMGVLKGADDARLRQTAQKAVNAWYKEHAGFYVDLLNLLHGFRKTQFQLAGLNDWMRPSLEQNRISGQALEAAMSAIRARADEIREAITARAPFFGKEKMSACDFFAPLPQKKASDAYIPYPQAIETLKAALKDVNPQIPEFVDMMLDKHWLEARVDAKKAGGAFYSRFNRLKQPRVFTTYLGSFGSVLQQAHELGHAFHYWVMRDMPTNQTEFPMTLTEVASTFNEAAVRRYCAGHATDDTERLTILWQELLSCANFCLQLPVRMSFEQRFIERRQNALVTQAEAEAMMQSAWKEYMGEAIEDCDEYLWCYKPHFYMTDQYIYNYAYTIGYLISQGLLREQQKRGETFPDFYRDFLRDTGRMTVDELIAKHMGFDASKPDFWNQCLDQACSYIAEFKALTQKVEK